ncbi:hypothetical protein LX36DRAFT_689689 [Colletotrichum falcatum]|nr:hypothetical protein LX36DRAFT_689689 [Colletotrichum falcatum]
MRSPVYSLVISTVASIALEAVVAVAAFRGKTAEPDAAPSSAATTAIVEMTGTPATAPVVLELNPLWTMNTVKPETIVINIRTDRPATTAADDGSLTMKCDHDWCQDSTPMRTHEPDYAGQDPAKIHIPKDPVTSLAKPPGPILLGDHEDLKTLKEKQYVASVTMNVLASASIDCKYTYCDDRTLYCMYWAGVTGWNPSLGPVPGMTRTTLGACRVPATDLTTYGSTHTTMASTKKRVCSTETPGFRTLTV